MTLSPTIPFFVFDVESVGLHGEGFAVAGGISIGGVLQEEFCYSCPPEEATGNSEDLDWVKDNVPVLDITHRTPKLLRAAFWRRYTAAKENHPGLIMAAECGWPVEAGFLARCIYDEMPARKWEGPYPFHEIATYMLAAGMDPMATYNRTPSELPKHHPLADARQSARLLHEAMTRLHTPNCRLIP